MTNTSELIVIKKKEYSCVCHVLEEDQESPKKTIYGCGCCCPVSGQEMDLKEYRKILQDRIVMIDQKITVL
jgi:hypothetical protein